MKERIDVFIAILSEKKKNEENNLIYNLFT
jgi:hypothetical protein